MHDARLKQILYTKYLLENDIDMLNWISLVQNLGEH
jgi:hypothetical protein